MEYGREALLLRQKCLPSELCRHNAVTAAVFVYSTAHGLRQNSVKYLLGRSIGAFFVALRRIMTVVYDKAKWHFEGDYPDDLNEEQAFVHTGLYLAWIIDNNLFSEEFAEDEGEMIEKFRRRDILPAQIYRIADGRLVDDMLSEEGNAFSQFYFDFEKGQFLDDYVRLLAADLPSHYHVSESWENYDRLKSVIDNRYKQWKRSNDKT